MFHLTTWAVKFELSAIVLQKLNLVNGVLFTGGWAKKGLHVDVVDGIFKVCATFKLVYCVQNCIHDILKQRENDYFIVISNFST